MRSTILVVLLATFCGLLVSMLASAIIYAAGG